MITSVAHNAGGIRFTFAVHTSLGTMPTVSGLYVFTKQNAVTGRYDALYVGQAGDFSQRVCRNHEHWQSAASRGMTHVLTCPVPNQADRDRYEQLLIRDLNPPLNTVHRATART